MDSSVSHRLMRQIRQLIRTPAQDPVSDRQLLQQFADLHDEAAFRVERE